MIKRFYHYTSIKNLSKIIKTGYLKPSYFSRYDTMHGEGWYLTDLSPNNADLKLQRTLWGVRVPEKTRCYVAFDIEEQLLKDCGQHIYLIEIDEIPDEILELDVEYFKNYTFYKSKKAKVSLKYAGHDIRKNVSSGILNSWIPIIKVVAVFVGVIGVTAFIAAILKSDE